MGAPTGKQLIPGQLPEGDAQAEVTAAPRDDAVAWATTIDSGHRAQSPVVEQALLLDLHPGDVLGDRYELLEQVGHGAFGLVFRAHDRTADEIVAIKILRYSQRHSAEGIQRIRRELRAARRVTHPGVVRIHDVIELGDRLALSMEFVEGETLFERLRRQPQLTDRELRMLATDLAQALAAAHEVGVVHCDLKPANVILRVGSGRAVITDFGVSRFEQPGDGGGDAASQVPQTVYFEAPDPPLSLDGNPRGSSLPTVSGLILLGMSGADASRRKRKVVGTPPYMAPELFLNSENVGPHVDAYALGVLLYEAASGVRPHESQDIREIIRARLAGPPAPLETLRPDLTPDLCRTVNGCLAHHVEERLTCEHVQRLLAPLSYTPAATTPVPAPLPEPALTPEPGHMAAATARPLPQHGQRRLRLVAGLGLGLALILASYWWWLGQLPFGERQLAISVVNQGDRRDDWFAKAIVSMATRKLRSEERRFRVVRESEDANVLARLAFRRLPAGVTLSAELGRRDGRMHRIGTVEAASVAAALEQMLQRVRAEVGAHRSERALDEAELAAMARLGATSYPAYRLYQQAIDHYFAAVLVDSSTAERQLKEALRIDPLWPHAYAALFSVQGRSGDAARATYEQALRVLQQTPRDPVGRSLIEALGLINQRTGEAARILEQAIKPTSDDILALYTLRLIYDSQQRPDESVAVAQRLHLLRPDLQFGVDVATALQRAGRSDELPALFQAWFERSPESEQGFISRIALDLETGRYDAAEQRTRDLLFLHGETPYRLVTLCDVLILGGQTREARTVANRLVGGTPRERALGRYRLGIIALMEGRFSAAHDSLATAVVEQAPFGGESELMQTLAALSSLDLRLGNVDDLDKRLDEQARVCREFGMEVQAVTARFERALLHVKERGCPDPEPFLASITAPDGRTNARRAMLRAAAAVGCRRCDEVLRAGLAPDEASTHSIFWFAACAQAEGAMQLAADAYRRAAMFVASSLHPVSDFSPDLAIVAHFRLGQVLEQMGRKDEARAEYERFLQFWDHADRPMLELDQARAALARLQ